MDQPEQPSADEALLDEVFERALEQIEEGGAVDVDGLVRDHPHLRRQAERLLRLAQEVAVIRCEPLPAIAGYTILSELGRGGMGTVYLARQERLGGRPVALKVLPHSASISAGARQRFLAEARAIARLQHPNIVAIHDVVEDGQTLAYAMDRVEGESLADLLAGHESLDPAFVCRVGIAISRALGEVHRAGLVHRDVKPSNILIRSDGTPLLTDFGLVRETDTTVYTQAGGFVGTTAYAAPEQLRGETDSIDARCDVYAIGATLYHALTSRPPINEASPAEVLRRVESGLIEPLRRANPRLPRDLQTIVHKAVEPDPARRYQSADELADDLERLLNLQPIRARPAGPITRTTKFLRRNRRMLAAAAVGAVLVLGLAVAAALYVLWLPRQIEANVREARLALLDPDQGNRIFEVVLDMSPQGPPAFSKDQADRAIRAYERLFLHRISSTDVQLEHAAVQLALRLSQSAGAITDVAEHLRRHAPLTVRYATDWSAQPEAPPRLSETDLESAAQRDLRCLGLLAFLCRDVLTSLDAWKRLDLVASPDPLVEASLGQLYLAMQRPDLAYPHAVMAFRHFGDVGFLCLNVADAAVQLGELDLGRQMLDRAATLAMHDRSFSDRRIWADYYTAIGEDQRAEDLYQFFVRERKAPTARDHYAKFLIKRGRLREAVEVYAGLLRLRGWVPEYQQQFMAAADGSWASLDSEQRLAEMRSALWGHGGFLALLKTYVDTAARQEDATNPVLAATLPPPSSAPFLQRADLLTVARRMEVSDMKRWSQINSYPRWLRPLQLAVWLSAAEVSACARWRRSTRPFWL